MTPEEPETTSVSEVINEAVELMGAQIRSIRAEVAQAPRGYRLPVETREALLAMVDRLTAIERNRAQLVMAVLGRKGRDAASKEQADILVRSFVTPHRVKVKTTARA